MKKQILFYGCGGMYNYFMGVANVLQENFDLQDVEFSGVSVGNIPAVLLSLNMPIDKLFKEKNIPFLENINNYITKSLFNWNSCVKKLLYDILPENVDVLLSNKYQTYITSLPYFESIKISNWDNKEMFIDTIIGSSFIPLFDTKLYQTIDNGTDKIYCLDGGLSNYNIHNKNNDNLLKLTIDMWRKMETNWFFCYNDITWANKLYKWGKEDALKNLEYFTKFGLKKNKID